MSLLHPRPEGALASVGFLAVRLAAGAALILHGWPKIQKALGWMPEQMGVHPALQAAAASAPRSWRWST
jgi:uncharacterized membrane protein YphA (DoxX/SURF4 family)